MTLTNFLERSRRLFPKKEIVSRGLGGKYRYTYHEFYERVCRLANVLEKLGIRQGDRVGTFAWNSHRHLELYFAAPCMGATLHTVNIRLFPDQISYILNHAEDKVLFVDEDLVPVIESLKDCLKTVQHFIIFLYEVREVGGDGSKRRVRG
ncbi:AMP-binding protein [Candidatus Acetothermia bacterium]|nr:AMP-binding protein [Candidatus Acetothermia bacterium]